MPIGLQQCVTEFYYHRWQLTTRIPGCHRHEKNKIAHALLPCISPIRRCGAAWTPNARLPSISAVSRLLPWLVTVSWSEHQNQPKKSIYQFACQENIKLPDQTISRQQGSIAQLTMYRFTLASTTSACVTANIEPIYGWSQPFEGTEHSRYRW